jgi:hypothetical protein
MESIGLQLRKQLLKEKTAIVITVSQQPPNYGRSGSDKDKANTAADDIHVLLKKSGYNILFLMHNTAHEYYFHCNN